MMAEPLEPPDPDVVHGRESFLVFVRALAAHRRASAAAEQESPSSPWGPDVGGWENTTIERFLDAAYRWAVDMGTGRSHGLQAEPSWRSFAEFLHCGRSYE